MGLPNDGFKSEQIQQLEAAVRIGDSAKEVMTSFDEFCETHDVLRTDVLFGLAAVGCFDVAYLITDAWLDTEPDDTNAKISILQFYSDDHDYYGGIRAAEDLLTTYPDNPDFYGYLAYAYKGTGDRHKVIEILKQGSENCSHPIFYQATAFFKGVASRMLPDHVKTALLDEVVHENEPHLPDAPHDASASSMLPLSVETQHAQEIGIDRAVLSGVLAHTSAGGKYCFQYGYSADTLDEKTEWRPTPPGCFSEVRDTTLSTLSSWLCYGSAHEYSVNPCAFKSLWPFAIDRNHLDGIGQLTLLYGWRPSALPMGRTPSSSRMHAIDLRGAKVSFQVRHKDMDTKGGSLVFGVGSHFVGGRPTEGEGRSWCASQWMMTGKPLACGNSKDEGWSDITFDVEADPTFWSYGSNNPDEQVNSDRYTYLPLAQMIRRHNGNLVMCQMFADEREIPEGEITLREGRVTYRDWSMLRNGYGAELVAFPGQERDSALRLTNGQYRNQSDGWSSVEGDIAPPYKFVWQLPEHSQPDGVVLVQHPRYPVQMAQVYLRDGGPDGKIVHAGLVSLPKPGFDQPKRTHVTIPDNVSATHLEVNLMQGQNADGIGLMGVEAFGQFIPQQSAIEPVTVCEDVGQLKPGSELHYRLVYHDENSTTEGEMNTLKLPEDATPLLHSLSPLEDDDRAWLVHGNPMGLDTKLEVRLDGNVIDELPFGRGDYRRHTVVRVPEDQYAPGKVLEVQAKNECGSSETLLITIS